MASGTSSHSGVNGIDDQDEFSSINITPLVDVVLVLLVIFMITAPTLYQQAMNVQLPQASSGEGQDKGIMQVAIDSSGNILVDQKYFSLDMLRDHLKTNHPASAMIMADQKTEHGKVISVLDVLKTSGISKFSFGVEKPSDEK